MGRSYRTHDGQQQHLFGAPPPRVRKPRKRRPRKAKPIVRSECPFCLDDWFHNHVSHMLLDVQFDPTQGQVYATFHPCCYDALEAIEAQGYEALTGRKVKDVLEEITGREVLEVIDEGDGTVVGRLVTHDPTRVDTRGKVTSPKGWQTEVFTDVQRHHRHHEPPQGWKFGVAITNGPVKVAVATVGRPVSRMLAGAHPDWLEVTRVATWGHPALRKNAVSKVYAAAAQRARQIGAKRLITYTIMGEESGRSLQASGWTPTKISSGGSWSREARGRQDKAPLGAKVRWEKGLSKTDAKAVRARKIDLPA